MYLIYTTEGNAVSYVWALALTIIAFALDGVDGYVARKLHMKNQSLVRFLILWVIELLKILTGYCLQLWVGLVSYSRLLLLATRGFITDTIRSAAMEHGMTPFGMQVNPVCKFITGSRFMRISYAVAKVLAFVLIIAAKIPVCPNRDIIWEIGYWAAVFAIVFCVVRGIPVILEAKYLFQDKKDA